jgi:hypothetical protein
LVVGASITKIQKSWSYRWVLHRLEMKLRVEKMHLMHFIL